MAKDSRYVVVHTQVGTKGQGDLVTAADFPGEENLDRLVGLGALRPATAEELDAWEAAQQLPAGTAEKMAALPANSPALATGQPGGAPLGTQPALPGTEGAGAPKREP